MPGPHSGPYPTGDPNPTPEQMDQQAAWILGRMARRASVTQIAAELGVSRQTIYTRLKLLISGHIPPKEAVRVILFERHDQLTDRLLSRLQKAEDEDTISNADYARFIAEARQLALAQAALVGAMIEAAPEPRPKREAVDWEVGEDDE